MHTRQRKKATHGKGESPSVPRPHQPKHTSTNVHSLQQIVGQRRQIFRVGHYDFRVRAVHRRKQPAITRVDVDTACCAQVRRHLGECLLRGDTHTRSHTHSHTHTQTHTQPHTHTHTCWPQAADTPGATVHTARTLRLFIKGANTSAPDPNPAIARLDARPLRSGNHSMRAWRGHTIKRPCDQPLACK